jgi:hypothetical protein
LNVKGRKQVIWIHPFKYGPEKAGTVKKKEYL